MPSKRIADFAAVRKEISNEADRIIGRTKQISAVPIYLNVYSPIDGQSDDIMADIENMVRSYIEKPNLVILAVSPADQDIATSDAIKIAREVHPDGYPASSNCPWARPQAPH